MTWHYSRKIKEALHYITIHLHEKVTLERVAEVIGNFDQMIQVFEDERLGEHYVHVVDGQVVGELL